jgi:hydrogenase/urease accessory protein HupE
MMRVRLPFTPRVAVAATCTALGLILVLAPAALAHWADLAVAEISVSETRTEVTLVLPTGLVREADDDRDGQLAASEVMAHQRQLEAFFAARVRLSDGARPGVLTIQPVDRTDQVRPPDTASGTHSVVRLAFTWPTPVRTLRIQYGLFLPGVPTASCLATIVHGGRTQNVVFTPEHREVTIEVGRSTVRQQVVGFAVLGVEHILSGYDHILFLISLLMLGGGLRQLVKVVSAFTLAHSLTLSLAALDAIALPARWVESAIALSIVYVAAENVWRREHAVRTRWLVTFAFGLVHGLGFAGILKELALTGDNLLLSLAGFNAGVEIGQVAIVGVLYLALRWLRASPKEIIVRRLVSAGAAAAGSVWFIQRALVP